MSPTTSPAFAHHLPPHPLPHRHLSFTSARSSSFSDPSPPPSAPVCTTPPPPALPPHASTSTISRSSAASRASSDPPVATATAVTTQDQQQQQQQEQQRQQPSPSPPPPQPRPATRQPTRIPKARVFVQRAHTPAPDRLRTTASARPPASDASALAPRRVEPRCVSDLHDAYRRHQATVRTQLSLPRQAPVPPPLPVARRPVSPRFEVPDDERRDWQPTPPGFATCDDPDDADSADAQRWGTSLRNFSIQRREREPPCIRGSVLEVRPPTFGERFGVRSVRKAERKGRKIKEKEDVAPTRVPGRKVHNVNEDLDLDGFLGNDESAGSDEYVGFLVDDLAEKRAPVKGRKGRNAWRRLLRRF